jgi:predicted ATPase
MLKRIFADNFRALVNFEFRPGRLSLILGENGSGKTSIFDVLGKIRDLVVLGVPSSALFAYSKTHWHSRDVQRFELDIDRDGGLYRYSLEIEHPLDPTGKVSIRSEVVTFDGAPIYRYSGGEVQLFQEDRSPGPVFPFLSDRSFLQNVDVQSARKMPRLLGFKSFMAGLWIVQPNPFAVDLFSRQEAPFLARNGSNFASFFSFLNGEHPDIRTELESRLAEAMPGFRNFSLQRMGDQKLLRAAFGLEEKVVNLDFGELSEGQRVLAILYGAVLGLGDSGAAICFDEPDNFVSLPEIQPWLQLLRDTVETRGGQAMIISHHPEVMDYLELDSVWHFDRPSGPVRVREHEPDRAPGDEVLRLSEIVARGM